MGAPTSRRRTLQRKMPRISRTRKKRRRRRKATSKTRRRRRSRRQRNQTSKQRRKNPPKNERLLVLRSDPQPTAWIVSVSQGQLFTKRLQTTAIYLVRCRLSCFSASRSPILVQCRR